MKLTDLEPQLLRHEFRETTWTRQNADGSTEEVTGPRSFFISVDTLAEAQGVEFLCPKCFSANGGAVGTHGIICWSRSRGVPDDVEPTPGRWAMSGTGLEDLTLNADPPSQARSILLTSGCRWHGFITAGMVTPAG